MKLIQLCEVLHGPLCDDLPVAHVILLTIECDELLELVECKVS